MIVDILVLLIGACIGSFAFSFSYRFISNEPLLLARSKCDSCNSVLKFYHLIPIFSYIMLMGRCEMCKANITVKHIVIEILCAVVCLMFWHAISGSFGILQWHIVFTAFIIIALLTILSLIDLELYEVPVAILYLCVVLLLIFGIFTNQNYNIKISVFGTIQNAAIIYFTLLFTFRILKLIFKKSLFGDGDIWLLSGFGGAVGILKTFLILYFASLICLFTFILLKFLKNKQYNKLPFFPFLSAGFVIVFAFFDEILNFTRLDWILYI